MLARARLAVRHEPGFPRRALAGRPRRRSSSPERVRLLRDGAGSGRVARPPRMRSSRRTSPPAVAEIIAARGCTGRPPGTLRAVESTRTGTRDRGPRPGEARPRRRHPRHAAGLCVHGLLRRGHGQQPPPDEGDLGRGARPDEEGSRRAAAAVDGEREATWIVADFIDVVLHVFTPEARDVLPPRGAVGRRPAGDGRSGHGLKRQQTGVRFVGTVVVGADDESEGCDRRGSDRSRLRKLGIGVSRPLDDERYDLILDLRPRFFRVQCKWAVRRGDVVRSERRRCTTRPRRADPSELRGQRDRCDCRVLCPS